MRSERSPILPRTACTSPTTSWPSTCSALPRGMRSATCRTARSSVVLMCSPANMASRRCLDAGGPGQRQQEAQRLVGRPVAWSSRGRGRPPRRSVRAARSGSSAKRSRRCRVEISLVVRRQRLPLRCRRQVHARQSTAARRRHAGAAPPRKAMMAGMAPRVLQEEAVAAVEECRAAAPGIAGPGTRCWPAGRSRRSARRRRRSGSGWCRGGPAVSWWPGRPARVGEPLAVGPPSPRRGACARRSARTMSGLACRQASSHRVSINSSRVCQRARRGSRSPARAAGRRRRPRRRPRCRPARAGAPARGAGSPAPGPPCRRRRSPITRQSSQPRASSRAAASSAIVAPSRRARRARCTGPARAGRRPGPRIGSTSGRVGQARAVWRRSPPVPEMSRSRSPVPVQLVVERDAVGVGRGHLRTVPTPVPTTDSAAAAPSWVASAPTLRPPARFLGTLVSPA